MYCIQTASSLPRVSIKTVRPVFRPPSLPRLRILNAYPPSRTFPVMMINVPKCHRCLDVCRASDQGMFDDDKDDDMQEARARLSGLYGSPENMQSLEDILRKQMEEGDGGGGGGGDDGGPGGRRPGGGGGGKHLPEDESILSKLDELLQVFLASCAVVCFYIYILKGVEPFELAWDYISFRFTGKKTSSLIVAMKQWGYDFENEENQEIEDENKPVSDEEFKAEVKIYMTEWEEIFGPNRILEAK